jgi:hypothetical protein
MINFVHENTFNSEKCKYSIAPLAMLMKGKTHINNKKEMIIKKYYVNSEMYAQCFICFIIPKTVTQK